MHKVIKEGLASISLFALLCYSLNVHAVDSELWQQFVAAKQAGIEPILPDYSYAGYDYSESTIPDISNWQTFKVTDYGAVANDGKYDDHAIQKTIEAAQAAGGGVVLFPKGRFMLSPNETVGENIRINASNIVLKGSGADEDGTIIFSDNKKVNNGRYVIEIAPTNLKEKKLTTLVADAVRESHLIEVADTAKLSIGQRIMLRTDSVEFARRYFNNRIDKKWTRLLDKEQGFRLRELHTITDIQANTVTLREPLHIDLTLGSDPIYVASYNMLQNVGIEDILFKGNWDSYPEAFVHHKDDIHDYAWNAIRMDNVENAWIRNIELKDWNQGIFIDGSAAATLQNIRLTGKKGHTSIHVRRSYGILIKDSQDFAGHHHGPGLGYWGTGTVYLRYQMSSGQRMDSHSGSPYASLFDNVSGGHFNGNGGPHQNYPHHGKYFVAWNFKLEGGPSSYNFWQSKRNGHTFAMPFFIGLQGKTVKMTKGTYAIDEHPGEQVNPKSLFEAQLALRLAAQTSITN